MGNREMGYLYSEITEKIIEAAFTVHRILGFGFLEKVYENALVIELENRGLKVDQQKSLRVYYKEQIAGEYILDLLVEDKIIVEVKALKQLIEIHEIQLLNYLKGCNLQVGLLINFGPSVEIKRRYQKSEKSG
jgi:GxxExxY protein